MDGENRMKTIKIILSALVMLLLLGAVYGFGVTTPYWDTNPLVMSPGQTVEFHLLLQNMAGDGGDIAAIASVTDGNEFAQITDTNSQYEVPFGTKDTKVNLKVSIPEGTPNGNHEIRITVDTIPAGAPGMLQLGTGTETRIPLQIVGGAPLPNPPNLAPAAIQEQKSSAATLTGILIGLGVLILLIVIIILYKKKKV